MKRKNLQNHFPPVPIAESYTITRHTSGRGGGKERKMNALYIGICVHVVVCSVITTMEKGVGICGPVQIFGDGIGAQKTFLRDVRRTKVSVFSIPCDPQMSNDLIRLFSAPARKEIFTK